MQPEIKKMLDMVMQAEGGYSDHPHDRGGRTNHGVTETTARASGYMGNMADLTQQQARDIYYQQYFRPIRGDEINALSWWLAMVVFEIAIMSGGKNAATRLQMILNILNWHGVDWPDLKTDGVIGSRTLNALGEAIKRGHENRLIIAYLSDTISFFLRIAFKDAKQQSFINGWINRMEKRLREYFAATQDGNPNHKTRKERK